MVEFYNTITQITVVHAPVISLFCYSVTLDDQFIVRVVQMRHYHINLTLFGIGFGIVGSFHYLCTIITVLVYEYKH